MYQHLHRIFRAAPQGNVTIDSRKLRTAHGFTIVELLVVIVVIAILAAITIVAYTGISSKATAASLVSDLDNASKQIKLFQVINGAYPTANNCPTPGSTEICLKASGGTAYVYTSTNTTNPQTFALTATKSGTSYIIADNTTPGQISANPTLSCPSGFIPVPGSISYGTADFCVMKYEAKNVAGVATSQAASTPWGSMTQPSAITTSAAACTGCHLITEGEYLTIAQNVLSVPTNWSTGTVGSGFIYSGHNDNAPANTLDADTNDSNGYYGTGNVANSNQKRTLTLSNGEVIWDLAGNAWEWTSGTSTTGQPGGAPGAGYNFREWTAVTNPGTISPNPSASATGIAGASSWNSGKGIGQIYSSADETGLRGFLRGGSWTGGGVAGVLALRLDFVPSNTGVSFGFRVSR
jgi:prepilin-type N-terminal cleavage/methylation domain-containing protein